jgi:hypothetical protein
MRWIWQSGRSEQRDNMCECLWDVYQRTGRYEDLTRWLKHRAYGKLMIDSLAFCSGDMYEVVNR